MKKILGWTVAALVSLSGVGACSSDSKSSSATRATTAEVTDGSTAASTEAGAGNAAVDEFCRQADDLAVKLKAVLADPGNADTAEVTASAAKLTTDAAALISSNSADVDQINACTKKLTDAATGG